MATTYHVMRKNRASTPPRFEYLRNRPDFTAAGALLPDGVTVAAVDTVTARWTWIDGYVGGVAQWRNGNAPFDFGRAKAARWAALIEDARMVHIGDYDAPAPTQTERDAAEQAAKRAARQEYAAALAAGTAEPL